MKSFLTVLANFSIEFITTRRYYGNEVIAADGLIGLLQDLKSPEMFCLCSETLG